MRPPRRSSPATPDDPGRLAGDLIRYGVIESVDLDGPTVIIRTGEVLSGPVPWFAKAAGDDVDWDPPSVGEQGLLICPEGDIGQAVFVPGLYSNRFAAPSNKRVKLRRFRDGAELSYDADEHVLIAALPAGARVVLKADGGVSIEGDVHIKGELTVDADVVAGSAAAMVSLLEHRHLGVDTGAGVSGKPAP